jgi:hypothetical protein
MLAPAGLRRVFPILMPLEAEGNLRLALSAKDNNFLKILIVILLPSCVVRRRRNDRSISLLDDAGRFYLVHEALLALQGITDRTSHRGFYCLLFFDDVKGMSGKSVGFICHQPRIAEGVRPGIEQFANFIVLPIKPSL